MVVVIGIFLFAIIAAFTSQSLVDLADFLLVGLALYYGFKNKDIEGLFKGFWPAWLWPVWLVVIFTGLALPLGINDQETWTNFVEFKWIFTLISVIFLTQKIVDLKKFFALSATILLILNCTSLFLFFYRHDGRTAGIFNAIMAFSHNIAPIFCLFTIFIFVNFRQLRRVGKFLVVTLALTSAVLTLLSYTRGVWIGSVVSITSCLLLWNYKKAGLFLIGLAIVGSILINTNQSVYDRTFSKTTSETSSNEARIALWRVNIRMALDHPIFGVGHNQNRYHLRKYYDELGYPPEMLISHAHNQYLQVWAGTGTLGLLCYLFFLFSIFKTAWQGYKNANEENKGLLLGLISALFCFVIGALTEANFNISKNRFLFLLIAGMAIGFSAKKPVEVADPK